MSKFLALAVLLAAQAGAQSVPKDQPKFQGVPITFADECIAPKGVKCIVDDNDGDVTLKWTKVDAHKPNLDKAPYIIWHDDCHPACTRDMYMKFERNKSSIGSPDQKGYIEGGKVPPVRAYEGAGDHHGPPLDVRPCDPKMSALTDESCSPLVVGKKELTKPTCPYTLKSNEVCLGVGSSGTVVWPDITATSMSGSQSSLRVTYTDSWESGISIRTKAGRVDKLTKLESESLQRLRQAVADEEVRIAKVHGVDFGFNPCRDGICLSVVGRPADSYEFRGQFLLVNVPK